VAQCFGDGALLAEVRHVTMIAVDLVRVFAEQFRAAQRFGSRFDRAVLLRGLNYSYCRGGGVKLTIAMMPDAKLESS
jgi:hypothetical protein